MATSDSENSFILLHFSTCQPHLASVPNKCKEMSIWKENERGESFGKATNSFWSWHGGFDMPSKGTLPEVLCLAWWFRVFSMWKLRLRNLYVRKKWIDDISRIFLEWCGFTKWFNDFFQSWHQYKLQGYNDGDCCWTSMGWKSHFGVDKCPEVRTLCHPHSVVMVFAMDVLRTIVLASIGSKVFWFQLKSFPFWSVAMCPHALSRIFWPSYHKNRYLFMTCYWWKKIEELVELVVNVSDHPSEEGCHCHEQRCILSLEKPRHGANGNAQNTNVNRIGSFLKLSHDATEIEVVSCKL